MTDLTSPTIDKSVLDGAVDFINRATHASGLQLAVLISEYVTDTFFGGDIGLLSSKDPTKIASFHALCQREDLQMGVSTLYRLVKIGHQVRQMPADLAESLTPAQHRALLSEPNPLHKQHLTVGLTCGQCGQLLELSKGCGRALRPSITRHCPHVRGAHTAHPSNSSFVSMGYGKSPTSALIGGIPRFCGGVYSPSTDSRCHNFERFHCCKNLLLHGGQKARHASDFSKLLKNTASSNHAKIIPQNRIQVRDVRALL